MPWAALTGKTPGRRLIDDYAIGTAAFGQQVCDLLSRDPLARDGLLVAGDIDYGPATPGESGQTVPNQQASELSRGAWERLPATRKETDAISELYRRYAQAESDPKRLVALRGAGAQESALLAGMKNARYVHVATHGFFASPMQRDGIGENLRLRTLFSAETALTVRTAQLAGRNPLLLSGLVMAGANLSHGAHDSDGLLTAEEIAGQELGGVELVVPSACDTGLGEVADGEGVFGLQRAFHLGGARAVLASLWKVDDNATQALMVEFYRNLWQRDLTMLQALREAQFTLIRDYDVR
jgi:CHAT domain-containing protein